MMDLAARIAALPPEKRDLLLQRLHEELEESQPAGGGNGSGGTTETERRLLALWAEILHVEAIGIHDNFFDAGGTSLLAARLLARLHEQLAVRLPLRSLFDAPTVAELAGRVEQARSRPVRGVQKEQRALRHALGKLEIFDDS